MAALLFLHGCSVLQRGDGPGTAATPTTDNRMLGSDEAARRDGTEGTAGTHRDAFTLEVRAPRDIRDFLLKHLELQRYRTLDDLQASELSRLLGAAEANARELMATLGYFGPRLTLDLIETPQDPKAPREVVVAVDPGTQTRIDAVQLDFLGAIDGAMATAPGVAQQRRDVVADWSLRPGQGFTQEAWDNAKSGGLRRITAQRFPTAKVATSRAEVDADRDLARLSVTYDSGPAYRFGPLQVRGNERYPPEVAQRLARIPVGADYDQAKLLEAQQRLAATGYFDSVFLTLDTEPGDPLATPGTPGDMAVPRTAAVIAQVRDAKLQKVVFGVGFSTDGGPRLSVDHTHNQLPVIGWRAVSKVLLDQKTKSIGSEQTSLPGEDGWRWVTSELLQRELSGSYEVNSGRLRGGRAKSTDRIDRSYFLQFDYAANQGLNAPPSASSLSLNLNWTGRYFNSTTAPTRGYGLALEAGPGYTLTGQRLPYFRTDLRALGFVPLGEVVPADGGQARRSRLQLRAEAGVVNARASAQIPATQLFLTGGDTTVRGYSYRQIGARVAGDQIFAGRYLGVASVEWQRPVVWDGEMTEFESVVFVDAGAVADRLNDLRAKVGVGTGVRWRSPVGPVQADVAYGVDAKALRLHLRLGFTF